MIPMPFAHNKSYAIFGLARSGMAVARALNASGAKVVLGDDQAARVAQAANDGFVVRDLVHDFPTDIAAIILSPGIPLTHPAPHAVVKQAMLHQVPVLGDTDLFAQAIARARGDGMGPRIVAITGTNGKSTTTALIGHVLSACGLPSAVGGNIGTAVFDLPLLNSNGVYSIEMSSFQIDLSPNFGADVACLLNITPDHLDRHGSLDNYAAVKAALLARARHDATLVIGVDTAPSAAIADHLEQAGRRVVRISVEREIAGGIYTQDGELIDDRRGMATRIAPLVKFDRMPGAHNAQNIATAFAALTALGLAPDSVIAAISSFPGLAHRLELIAVHKGVRIINDSKATNADATEKALSSFDRIHWIAGGMPKQGGIEPLRYLFPRVCCAYLIGQAQAAFAETLSGNVETKICGTLDRAFADALASAKPGDVILLSPAAASFDQFSDFEARGEAFRKLVMGAAS
jgi:UDP-N-acetylmuramoylalanine--D-glutamate ligase